MHKLTSAELPAALAQVPHWRYQDERGGLIACKFVFQDSVQADGIHDPGGLGRRAQQPPSGMVQCCTTGWRRWCSPPMTCRACRSAILIWLEAISASPQRGLHRSRHERLKSMDWLPPATSPSAQLDDQKTGSTTALKSTPPGKPCLSGKAVDRLGGLAMHSCRAWQALAMSAEHIPNFVAALQQLSCATPAGQVVAVPGLVPD